MIALVLIKLTGPDGGEVDFNPAEIVSLRPSGNDTDTFHENVSCVIRTADGNSFGVRETCQEVRKRIDHAE
jgi:hypothetical protein